MAIVSRAARNFEIKKDKEGAGPGSYLGLHEYKRALSFAPFASSTERTSIADAANNKTKGDPGFYSPLSGFAKVERDVQNMKKIQKEGLEKYGLKLM